MVELRSEIEVEGLAKGLGDLYEATVARSSIETGISHLV
jgi:hypothetical protein